jgi:hypothetical protein
MMKRKKKKFLQIKKEINKTMSKMMKKKKMGN